MNSEQALQTYLLRQASYYAIYARKVQAVGHTGFPDVFLSHGSRVALVEIKSPTGRGELSKKQELEISRIEESGTKVYVIENKEEADYVIAQFADA